MIVIRDEQPRDVPAREALLDLCFGPARFAKTCERLREGRRPADGLALAVERDGRLRATVRLWDVMAGSAGRALMLGPIAVDPALQGTGIGARLIQAALERAREGGHRAILLVGDAPYYERFGFSAETVAGLWLPGPWEPGRFLGLDLLPGTLAAATGMVAASGRPDSASFVRMPRAA